MELHVLHVCVSSTTKYGHYPVLMAMYQLIYMFLLHSLLPYLCFHSNLYFSSSVGIQSLPLTGGPVTTIWSRNEVVLDLTLDIQEQVLFWLSDLCVSEHRILSNHTIYGVWCDFHHDQFPDPSPLPSLINYFNDKLYILLHSVDQLYYYNEHNSQDGLYQDTSSWSTIFEFELLHGDNITSFKFSHYSVQPGE